jgi:sugar phosphate isomerase/epimerase
MNLDNIVVSPCSNPDMELEPALAAYSKIGYRRFEAFTASMKSLLDCAKDPAHYRALGKKFGMSFYSMHMPTITDDIDGSLAKALKAAELASAIGVKVVLFKANTRALYIAAAKRFLDGIQGLGITPVLQNHAGKAISTIADFREVLGGINDGRMKTLLEVGHFHSVGVLWPEGYSLLRETVALVHIKDQIGAQSVPFGKGEIDLPGLFKTLTADGYRGNYVVEMEVADRNNTLQYLTDALSYLKRYAEAA